MSVAYLEARVGTRLGDFRLDVGFELAAGGRLAVIGPNGAGKSTLLATLAGQSKLTDGFIRLDGRELATAVSAGPRRRGARESTVTPVGGGSRWPETHLPPRSRHVAPHRRGVVLLSPQPYLFDHLTVRANIEYGPRARGVTRAAARAEAEDLIVRLGLGEVADRPSRGLSDGQAQRVALARALAAGPKLLLLDEPFAALDVTAAGAWRQVTAALLGERGTTAVVVSHSVLDVVALADRVLVLDGGQVVEEGPTAEVLGRPRTDFAAEFVGLGLLPGRLAGGRFVSDAGWSCPAPQGDGLWSAGAAAADALGGSSPALTADAPGGSSPAPTTPRPTPPDGPARLIVPPEAVTPRRPGDAALGPESVTPRRPGDAVLGPESVTPRRPGDAALGPKSVTPSEPGGAVPGRAVGLTGRLVSLTTASSGLAATIAPDGGGPPLRLFLTLAAAWLPVGEPVEFAIDTTKTRVIS